MKTIINYPKCKKSKNSSILLGWLFYSVSQRLRGLVKMKVSHLRLRFAEPGTLIFLTASSHCLHRLYQNKRHLTGGILLVLGAVVYFAHNFLFNPYDISSHNVCNALSFSGQCWDGNESGWCFVSWFYYWEAVNLFIAMIVWSVAGFLLVPLKFSGVSSIAFSFFNAFSWVMLIHRSFYATSHETYHSIPLWHVVVLGLALGFGVVLSAGNIMYHYHHKQRGNHQRWVGVHKLDIDQAMKNRLFDELVDEYNSVKRMM